MTAGRLPIASPVQRGGKELRTRVGEQGGMAGGKGPLVRPAGDPGAGPAAGGKEATSRVERSAMDMQNPSAVETFDS